MSFINTILIAYAVIAARYSQGSSSDVRETHRGDEVCLRLTPSPKLQPFVDALPTMPKIYLSSRKLTLGSYKIIQKLHRDLPPTTLYAFGTSQETASYPGPTLIASYGQTAYVRWENHILDREHILPLDETIDWANPRYRYVPMVVHLHGQEVESKYDGHPLAWFTSIGETGSSYVTQDYFYPNRQRPALLWYHDHTYGIARLNMAAGLVGLYVLEDNYLDPVWVPKEYTLLVLQDKQFYDDGFIKYPNIGINPRVHPQWCPDYFGDTVVVNGKVWPYVEVYPRLQRFRAVNADNSRFYMFNLNDSRLSFVKIGTDHGYLENPIKQRRLRLGPAERVDLIIDFSRLKPGASVIMYNSARPPFSKENRTMQNVLLFKVVTYYGKEYQNRIPQVLTPNNISTMSPIQVIRETTGINLLEVEWARLYNRPLQFHGGLDSGSRVTQYFLQDRLEFIDPYTERVKLYTDEIWAFINNVATEYPIHLHLINFFVLGQQPFNPTRLNSGNCSFSYDYPDPRSCYVGPFRGPDADQVGFKDTALVRPLHVTRFYTAFRPNLLRRFPFDPSTFPGYTWHCHLLEHQDNEMLRPFIFSNTEALYSSFSFPRYLP